MKTLKLPKTLTLDYAKWVHGNSSEKRGDSALLNDEGYQCCLGQFAQQAGVSRKDMKREDGPSALTCAITNLSTRPSEKTIKSRLRVGLRAWPKSTKLTSRAITINDSYDTTIAKKVSKLRKLFASYGYTIKLKNFPKTVLKELKLKSKKGTK